MGSKLEAMKIVARMIRNDLKGIVAWASKRITNENLGVLNGLFQAARRKAQRYRRLSTIRTVIFLLAGKLDRSKLNAYVV